MSRFGSERALQGALQGAVQGAVHTENETFGKGC